MKTNPQPMNNKPVLTESGDVDVCSIIFERRNDFVDVSGCLKPKGHNDHHVCRTNTGELMAWEDDYTCTCGCWEEAEKYDAYNDVCGIYWPVKSITE